MSILTKMNLGEKSIEKSLTTFKLIFFCAPRYHGTGVKLGECGISIMGATINDSGSWSCHMGTIGDAGLEASEEINVRVSGKKASTSIAE